MSDAKDLASACRLPFYEALGFVPTDNEQIINGIRFTPIKYHWLNASMLNTIGQIAWFPIDHSFLTYKKELMSYGYQVEKISMKDKTVLFKKYIKVIITYEQNIYKTDTYSYKNYLYADGFFLYNL